MDELKAKTVLKEVKDVLDGHEVEFWLNFGGLLGAIRDGQFISYDNDIELNAWKHKVTEMQMADVSRDLCQRGFNVYYSTLTDYISIQKDNIPIAFSMYTLEGGNAERPHDEGMDLGKPGENVLLPRIFYYLAEVFARKRIGKLNKESVSSLKNILVFIAVTLTSLIPEVPRRKIAIFFIKTAGKLQGEFGRTRIPARFYLELRDFEFYAMTLKVPYDTEEYLEFVYGPDWKTPIKDWNFHDSDKKSITGIEFIRKAWNYK